MLYYELQIRFVLYKDIQKNNLVTKNGFCGLFNVITSHVSSSKCENVPLWFTKRSGKPASLSVSVFFRQQSSTESERKTVQEPHSRKMGKVMTFSYSANRQLWTSIVNFNFAGFRAGSLRHRDRNQLDPTCFGFPLSFFSFRVGSFTWIRSFSILKSYLMTLACENNCPSSLHSGRERRRTYVAGYYDSWAVVIACIVSSSAFSKLMSCQMVWWCCMTES